MTRGQKKKRTNLVHFFYSDFACAVAQHVCGRRRDVNLSKNGEGNK